LLWRAARGEDAAPQLISESLGRIVLPGSFKPAFRPAAILLGWVIAPIAFSLVTAALGWSIALFTLILTNLFLVPYPSTVARQGPGFVVVWAFPTAVAIAVVQWVAVALVFGWLVRNRSPRVQFWLAPLAIVIAIVMVQLALRVLGYEVQVDAP